MLAPNKNLILVPETFRIFIVFLSEKKSEMDFKIGVFDVFGVFSPVFRNLKIHLIHRRCILMYSPCIGKWLNTVYEYTEYTKYIIFQFHLRLFL